ncbi:hypothetical protein ADUPG1_009954 [Aduncisulcus paluster]|uniref:Uncharacterized protein n=1 Tax=Aduncisulcus paluster TaxID=2918883 RepID=A0ABQ5L051_9EUKA|nr:hypothetical protein ADUPG1_009954 [Aduncisulcus paluster]
MSIDFKAFTFEVQKILETALKSYKEIVVKYHNAATVTLGLPDETPSSEISIKDLTSKCDCTPLDLFQVAEACIFLKRIKGEYPKTISSIVKREFLSNMSGNTVKTILATFPPEELCSYLPIIRDEAIRDPLVFLAISRLLDNQDSFEKLPRPQWKEEELERLIPKKKKSPSRETEGSSQPLTQPSQHLSQPIEVVRSQSVEHESESESESEEVIAVSNPLPPSSRKLRTSHDVVIPSVEVEKEEEEKGVESKKKEKKKEEKKRKEEKKSSEHKKKEGKKHSKDQKKKKQEEEEKGVESKKKEKKKEEKKRKEEKKSSEHKKKEGKKHSKDQKKKKRDKDKKKKSKKE